MPYPSHLAATMSGASVRQLQYWRESKLLVPEFGKTGGRLLYSFADVVALRTFVFLRESASLQLIRKPF
jgi:DNA-binding transcriptional MerR regulator